jgi:hypothetical protein
VRGAILLGVAALTNAFVTCGVGVLAGVWLGMLRDGGEGERSRVEVGGDGDRCCELWGARRSGRIVASRAFRAASSARMASSGLRLAGITAGALGLGAETAS